MNEQDLRALLDLKYRQFNQPGFIVDDPVSIPHQFSEKEDIEISGFLSALIAWGQRKTIIQNARSLMERMDQAPFQYVMQAEDSDLARLEGFVHRTFNAVDARALVLSLRRVYTDHGGLEGIFTEGIQPQDETVFAAIVRARMRLVERLGFPGRTHKHVANPSTGSSAKRINMYLRWMVRRDGGGVDFGLWSGIDPGQLICPLDVHTGKVARQLGLLQRKQNDWKAAVELTRTLRQFCLKDPVRYDFSLFGLGVSGELQ